MTTAAQAVPTRNREFALIRAGLAAWVGRTAAIVRNLGPYAALELLLPGGSVLVVLLWLYRRYKSRTSALVTACSA